MRNVKGRKQVKKIHKTVKVKQNHFYFKGLSATSEQQKTPQDSEYN